MNDQNSLTITGEEAFDVKLANEGKIPKAHPINKVLKDALEECKSHQINPLHCSFNGVPMGANNSMANYIPDIRHVFGGGLIKSTVLWILPFLNHFLWLNNLVIV